MADEYVDAVSHRVLYSLQAVHLMLCARLSAHVGGPDLRKGNIFLRSRTAAPMPSADGHADRAELNCYTNHVTSVRRRVGHATRAPHKRDIPRDSVAGGRDMPRVRRVR